MFYKIIGIMKGIFDNIAILMIFFVALFTLLVDGRKFKRLGYVKEFNLARIISYSYIIIGASVYILLKFV
ncbi:hypothetical protein KQI42_03295 [Tissierella sp. MSJ-40]|uniref:Uncharacterized protein n=1 Tax=Tissierella simiarum TaxID=2841534 RepID=A0ABS6E437_9FIRM|nr:CLC_0170 family protein [Tissierella simiarum]MBU5437019.1 hypothetical protein [Tissierella simiarum]